MRVDMDKDLEELRRKKMDEMLNSNKNGHNILIYRTPTCPYCHMAAEYLRRLGVEFREVDVSRDQAAAIEMIRKSGQMGVPVIDIDGMIIIGFDRLAIDSALSKVR